MSSATRAQRPTTLIRFAGLTILILIAAFPPWQITYSLNGQKQSSSVGYRPIWNPPTEEVEVEEGAADLGYRVNVVRLAIQLVVILGAMNGAIYLVRRRSNGPS